MPRNPLLGVDNEDEIKEETLEDGSTEESEDENLNDSEEEASDEDEESEEKPMTAAEIKAAEKAAKKLAAKAEKKAVGGLTTGSLGDARIDMSVPLSQNGRVYWNALLNSPLVASIIPPDMLNEETEHVFCINSLRVIVPKGQMIQVPLLLAQEIAQNFKRRL